MTLARDRKFAISNLAWPADCADEALAHAVSLGFTGIEIAPSKTFGGWPDDLLVRAADYAKRLAGLGLAVPAMQAILFGIDDARLFGSNAEQDRLKEHLRLIARLAGALGARACVFGAPRLRDRGGLPYEAAFAAAATLFRAVAPAFAAEGSAIAFEANPEPYGCNFVVSTAEAITLVGAVAHPGFRLQIDTGTIILNRESPQIIAKAAALAAHMHVSEPMLDPIGSNDHTGIAGAVRTSGYANWLSVEMRESADWRAAMTRAAAVLADCYQ